MIEALASGVPVAAFPVSGPIDILNPDVDGVISEDLGEAAIKALSLSRAAAHEHGMRFSWRRTAALFLNNIEAAHRQFGSVARPGEARRRFTGRPNLGRPAVS
jgi:glycosyltransferase involved in cell wall biosynthesis